MPVNVKGHEPIEIEAGQRWRTRGGKIAQISSTHDRSRNAAYPVQGVVNAENVTWTFNGRFSVDSEDSLDLVGLIDDTQAVALPPTVAMDVHQTALQHQALKTMEIEGYESLAGVLHEAYAQAAVGKGHERHSNGERFEDQVMGDMAHRFGVGALLGQAFKKSEESQRLDDERGIKELLGAINYLAGAVIAIRRQRAAEGLS